MLPAFRSHCLCATGLRAIHSGAALRPPMSVPGNKTRIIDHGHKVDAIFYSRDGSSIQLWDTASIETQVLEGETVIHSDQAQVQYIAVMTGAEDRWKVRVLESVPSQ